MRGAELQRCVVQFEALLVAGARNTEEVACGLVYVTIVHTSHSAFEPFDLLLGCVFNPLGGLCT
jgi:hypothetical protein